MSTIEVGPNVLPQRQLDGVSVTRALVDEVTHKATDAAVKVAEFGAEMSSQGQDQDQIPAVPRLDTFA